MDERTLILIKPDGVRRRITGNILNRIERKGYNIVALKRMKATKELLSQHYQEHVGKEFYLPMINFMLSGDLVAIIVEGTNVIQGIRSLMGTTNPTYAAPGTIRGDYGREWENNEIQNVIHGADSKSSAEFEMSIWFPELYD